MPIINEACTKAKLKPKKVKHQNRENKLVKLLDMQETYIIVILE
jgi:hypothetical protein